MSIIRQVKGMFYRLLADFPFIVKINFNKLGRTYQLKLQDIYLNSKKVSLTIGCNNFKYTFGDIYTDYIEDETWSNHFNKLITYYADICNECFTYSNEAKVIHNLTSVINNFDERFSINPTNNSVYSLLTCITSLCDKDEYIDIRFKYFKSVRLYSGETIIFPSHFEYAYGVYHKQKDNALIVLSQVYLQC
jgi:hypothetical protein